MYNYSTIAVYWALHVSNLVWYRQYHGLYVIHISSWATPYVRWGTHSFVKFQGFMIFVEVPLLPRPSPLRGHSLDVLILLWDGFFIHYYPVRIGYSRNTLMSQGDSFGAWTLVYILYPSRGWAFFIMLTRSILISYALQDGPLYFLYYARRIPVGPSLLCWNLSLSSRYCSSKGCLPCVVFISSVLLHPFPCDLTFYLHELARGSHFRCLAMVSLSRSNLLARWFYCASRWSTYPHSIP